MQANALIAIPIMPLPTGDTQIQVIPQHTRHFTNHINTSLKNRSHSLLELK